MNILAIETSCDETAIAVVEATGNEHAATFHVLGNTLLSQIELHRQYGGVFPTLAKREHAKNLVPLTRAALEEAELLKEDMRALPDKTRGAIAALLEREPELAKQFFDFITEVEPPTIDAIAVTAGPGLAPALWVGVNFAKALSVAWGVPIVAANHMEGHILSALAARADDETIAIEKVALPVLALLISGGHTELVLMRTWLTYELVGETRDDAVGEAFDKVARLLDLPYPGGPEISKLAEHARKTSSISTHRLPRPMLADATCDFSFAGLKTATRYMLQDLGEVDDDTRTEIALEFENAATDVLLTKTLRALDKTDAKTLVLGGGVSANAHIRRVFTETIAREHPDVSLHIPHASLTTDNALMIAFAGFYHALRGEFADLATLQANGNASLGTSTRSANHKK
ncbi:MAG: tRNA (adenosine(37)-N6)-threonylcarbamoyltransferase complex transferase subunit TsaD [Parcubacteria group bacterium 21-54-25]|nr:MAG: tRNA (adenosine(37)-N6)-threonylcarbamoyltransferase complex transferase subunit TsaD [Parcubacteria group bacterium 21-54-25]HQU08144.1 tRNA (adenosine(37)-N6)-threonylcarbamoyltransferase complex transferase subunit TsaD [Candidatus Paceibacterota bacterium]